MIRLWFLVAGVLVSTQSFVLQPPSRPTSKLGLFDLFRSNSSSSPASTEEVGELEGRIDACLANDQDPRPLIAELEGLNTVTEPIRLASFRGCWHVWYTDCPPPSNGQLGPFQGTAEQVIKDEGDGYQNILRVPPNDWLMAVLDGRWEDWDGKLLDTGEPVDSKPKDYGADHWKVTFLQLQISVFGFPVFTKEFDAGTCRVWRTSFLSDEIRVVRAGKTGRREDEVVFYTKRTPAPS